MTEVNYDVDGVCSTIINAGALEIRDIDGGEEPFLYSSGNYGPGYVNIKGLVGQRNVLMSLVRKLALKISVEVGVIDFIAGNVTGGQIPGWILSELLGIMRGHNIPYVYIRPSRKKGGHKKVITGDKNNDEIEKGMHCIDVEELINYAETTANAIEELRLAGYNCRCAATILSYENPVGVQKLRDMGIKLISLVTLEDLLRIAEIAPGYSNAIRDYREFLKNPLGWQEMRGFKPVENGGT